MLVTKINTSHPAHIRLRHCLTNRSATLTMAITLGCMHCAKGDFRILSMQFTSTQSTHGVW